MFVLNDSVIIEFSFSLSDSKSEDLATSESKSLIVFLKNDEYCHFEDHLRIHFDKRFILIII